MADQNQKKFLLSENDIPKQWYNISADLPNPLDPPLHPGTGQPAGPDDLAPLFPMELIMQEVSQDRWIDMKGLTKEPGFAEEILDGFVPRRPGHQIPQCFPLGLRGRTIGLHVQLHPLAFEHMGQQHLGYETW